MLARPFFWPTEVLTPASSRNWLKGSESFCGPPGMAFSLGKYLAKVMAAPRSSLTKDGGGPLQIASAIGTSDDADFMQIFVDHDLEHMIKMTLYDVV
jgi:hypothetical protein